MKCGLCKQPIRGDENYVTDHYKCSADLAQSFRADIAKVEAERDRLRAALATLIGVDGREELEQLEAVMRLLPAPAEDRAHSIDAIHALCAECNRRELALHVAKLDTERDALAIATLQQQVKELEKALRMRKK